MYVEGSGRRLIQVRVPYLILADHKPFQHNHLRGLDSNFGLGSVVGVATAYWLDCPGIESQWGEISRTSPDLPWGPPSLLYNGYRVFPGGKVLPGHDADP